MAPSGAVKGIANSAHTFIRSSLGRVMAGREAQEELEAVLAEKNPSTAASGLRSFIKERVR